VAEIEKRWQVRIKPEKSTRTEHKQRERKVNSKKKQQKTYEVY
jgi:hypothetical protein